MADNHYRRAFLVRCRRTPTHLVDQFGISAGSDDDVWTIEARLRVFDVTEHIWSDGYQEVVDPVYHLEDGTEVRRYSNRSGYRLRAGEFVARPDVCYFDAPKLPKRLLLFGDPLRPEARTEYIRSLEAEGSLPA